MFSLKAAQERQRWHREQTVLRLQLEALQAERDTAEQDLLALYDLHVQATRARTCHVLQVSGDRRQALSWLQGWPLTDTSESGHRYSEPGGGCGKNKPRPQSSTTAACWLASYKTASTWLHRTRSSKPGTNSFSRHRLGRGQLCRITALGRNLVIRTPSGAVSSLLILRILERRGRKLGRNNRANVHYG